MQEKTNPIRANCKLAWQEGLQISEWDTDCLSAVGSVNPNIPGADPYSKVRLEVENKIKLFANFELTAFCRNDEIEIKSMKERMISKMELEIYGFMFERLSNILYKIETNEPKEECVKLLEEAIESIRSNK